MNKRIKKLALSHAEPDVFRPNDPMYYTFSAEELEEFAKNIVRDCGDYLMQPEFLGRRDLDWDMVINERYGIKK